ncbi:hypothetical protein NX059_012277 [Plenodomus lindquistii]|nr:hypothetical protein NX059_012277 [Plenodomus lindquistii]
MPTAVLQGQPKQPKQPKQLKQLKALGHRHTPKHAARCQRTSAPASASATTKRHQLFASMHPIVMNDFECAGRDLVRVFYDRLLTNDAEAKR